MARVAGPVAPRDSQVWPVRVAPVRPVEVGSRGGDRPPETLLGLRRRRLRAVRARKFARSARSTREVESRPPSGTTEVVWQGRIVAVSAVPVRPIARPGTRRHSGAPFHGPQSPPPQAPSLVAQGPRRPGARAGGCPG